MGHFFNQAKTSLRVPEREIRLAVGRRTLTAHNKEKKFFALQEVQSVIGGEEFQDEVKINVVRVDPVHEKLKAMLQIAADQRERHLRRHPYLSADHS